MVDAWSEPPSGWPSWAAGVAPAAAIWGNSTPFANHDCVAVENPVLDWDRLRDGLRPACGHTRETRTLECAATITGWEDHILPFLRIGVPASQARDRIDGEDFPAFNRIEAEAKAQCPIGVLLLTIARTMLCTKKRDPDCYLRHNLQVSLELFELPLTVIMGTQWPVYALLNSNDWSWPGIPPGNDYDCVRSKNSTITNWDAMRSSFSRGTGSWWMDSVRFVFSKQLAYSLYTGSRECLYGVYVMNIVKAMWAADTESSSFRVYAPYVPWVLYESLHLLGASGWPIFALLHHFTSLRRHGFQLDFTAEELGRLPWRQEAEWLQGQPRAQHAFLIGAQDFRRPRISAAVGAFRAALQHDDSSGLRLAYVTMVYGKMNPYIRGWAMRFRRLGLRNLVMATLDQEAFDLCQKYHYGEQCVPGSISVLNKYTLLLIGLQLGVDVMWLDFDIFVIRDPGPAIARAAEGYDLLMGYDYTSDCICNGFFYVRARPETHLWLFELVRWLYDNPYEHDQRAISAFLNYTEKISAKSSQMPPVPRWFVFDVDNTFVNWNSWEGRYERLQLVHFVDGSAFSLYGRPSWDPSIPEAKVAEADGWVHEDESAVVDTPMQAFYVREAIDADPEDFFGAAPALKRLLDAQVKPRPALRQACGILPSVETANKGYGWIVEALEAAAAASPS